MKEDFAMLYVDGKWVEADELAVHPEDRGYNFGDGIYEVVRIYKGKMYQWDAHLTRLFRSAREIKLDLPWTAAELKDIAQQLIVKNNLTTDDDAILYLQVTRGVAPRLHDIPSGIRPVIMGFVRRKERPLADQKKGLTAQLVEDIRWLRCDIKTLNLLGAVLVKQYAKEAGAQESILHRNGIITECSASNLFAVKDNALYTHPADNLVLHGITRQTVIDLAKANGIPVHEEAFDIQFLKQADELFLSSTTAEVMPIVAVDGQPVGSGQVGPMVQKLQQLFEQHIYSEVLV
jgi:D-alanine transaminase